LITAKEKEKRVNALTTKIMVSIREASEHTGLSCYAVRKLCLTGQITFVRSGVKFYINLPKLMEYLNEGEGECAHLSV
jgi:hypothetical protein